jgi:hypothetical protein
MSATVSASKHYYVISIDSKKSGATPRNQKDFFPVQFVEFPDVGSKVNLSDDSTYVSPSYPLFTTYDIASGVSLDEASGSLIEDLNKVLYDLRNKQEPTKVILRRVVNQDKEGKLDVKQYEADTEIELDAASIHLVSGTKGTYQIQADKATLGVGDKATGKIEIDYKNRI